MDCVYIYKKVDTCKSTGGHAGSPDRISEKWEASWTGNCRGIWAGSAYGSEDEKVSDCQGITTEILKEAGTEYRGVTVCCTEHSQGSEEAAPLTENMPCAWMLQVWFVNLCTGFHLKNPQHFWPKASGDFEQADGDSPRRVWAPRGTFFLLSPLQLLLFDFCCFALRWVGTVVPLPSVPALLPAHL